MSMKMISLRAKIEVADILFRFLVKQSKKIECCQYIQMTVSLSNFKLELVNLNSIQTII